MAVVSLGATIVVDDDGSTPDLATALASALPGDTVQVLPGTYHGSFTVPAGVRLVGSGPDQTLLVGDGARWTVLLGEASEVRGFSISDGQTSVSGGSEGARILGNVIENNTGAIVGGGVVLGGCGTLLKDNVIRNNQTSHRGGGLWVLDRPPELRAEPTGGGDHQQRDRGQRRPHWLGPLPQ